MSFEVATFDHDSPSAPSRAAGMLLGVSGVTHAQLHTIGALSGTSATNGQFNDAEGYGHIDYHNDYLYVFDSGNNRIQRFALGSDGLFAYDSKLDGVTTLVGGGSATYGVLAIDRTNNQIHVTLGDYTQTSGAWISVWNLSDWPSLTTLNRVRQYGSNSGSSDASGRSYLGLSLTIDATYAIVASAVTPFRLLRWNHQTGVLQNQETQGAAYSQFTTDGADNWWSGSNSGASEPGLYKMDVTSFTASGSRIDTASNNQWRIGQFVSASASPRPFYHSGRIYARDYLGGCTGWNSSSGALVDDFTSPGALGPSNTVDGTMSGAPSLASVIYRDKGNVVVVGDKSYFVCWSHNASGSATQCFLTVYPLTTSAATWTKTDWSEGTNTLAGVSIQGANLSGEKFKIRLRKNAGSWVTVTCDDLFGSSFATAISGLGTFTDGDTLTVELSLSTWDRLDGHSTLTATRDKLSPSNVSLELYYTDTAATVFTPIATGSFKAKMGASGAFKARVQG